MEDYSNIYKAVKKSIKKEAINLEATGNTYAWLCNRDGKLHHERSYMCFGWTARYTTRLRGVASLVYARCDSRLPIELQESYIRWVVEESPYKGTILNNVEDILSKGIVIGDAVNSPLNMMYGAMFCIRMAHERSVIVEMWGKLVEGGLPKTLAFFLANCFTYTGDGRDYDLRILHVMKLTPGRCSRSDHMPLLTEVMGVEAIINFLSDEPSILRTDPLCATEDGIYHVQKAFSDEDDSFYEGENKIKEWFSSYLLPKTVCTNPFMSSAMNKMPDMTMDEAADFCINNWKNFLEWLHD